MASEDDEYDFGFGKPVDDDYVHPEEGERAELSVDTHERETAAQGKFWTSENTGVAMSTDARSGSGADTDALIDSEAIQENDGRSTSATFFYTGGKSFSEPVADSGPNYSMDRAERLAKYNDDWRINAKNYSRTTENMTVFRQKFVRLVCEELGMTTNQEERVFETVESINMKHMACYNTEQVVLSVATLVADEDAIQHAMATDSDDLRWIREEEECRSLMDDLLLEPGDVRKCRKLIKDKGSQDWRNT